MAGWFYFLDFFQISSPSWPQLPRPWLRLPSTLSLQQLPNLAPNPALNFNPFSKQMTKCNSCHLILIFLPLNQAYKALPHLASPTSPASSLVNGPLSTILCSSHAKLCSIPGLCSAFNICLSHSNSLNTLTKWKNEFLEDSYSLGTGAKE